MTMMMIALYYCYTPYKLNVKQHILFHEETCELHELKGRVRVSEEGINGVLSGSEKMLKQYETIVRQHIMDGNDKQTNLEEKNTVMTTLHSNEEEFKSSKYEFDFDVKYCHLRPDIPVKEQLFDTLSVKQTREVVSLHEPSIHRDDVLGSIKSSNSRRRRRRRRTKQPTTQQETKINSYNSDKNYTEFATATHLTPQEWHQHLSDNHHSNSRSSSSSSSSTNDKILIDARNIYESNVGHFQVPGIPTILTNTRKYSSLPQILSSPQVRRELRGKDVYMYCTGGVRCERASQYLASLVAEHDLWVDNDNDSDNNDTHHGEGNNELHNKEEDGGKKAKPPLKIYQLEGGIQRYLEFYGEMENTTVPKSDSPKTSSTTTHTSLSSSSLSSTKHSTSTLPIKSTNCLYKGKNFVFDPRRTDPKVGPNAPGICLLCKSPHDDYDNGFAPSQGKEARCYRCRVLILVCNTCRRKVRCWGEEESNQTVTNGNDGKEEGGMIPMRPTVFCGKNGMECVNQGNNLDDIEII